MFNIRTIQEKDFFSQKTNEDKIKFLLQYAILAPSTHNTQPWQFKIGENYCDIYIDPEKRLPHSDKTDKWLYVSIGCCIENLITAAQYFSVYESSKMFFKGNHVTRIYFKFDINKKVNKDYKKKFNVIPLRQNKRGIFIDKPIEKAKFEILSKSYHSNPEIKAHFITNRSQIKSIADLTANGLKMASKNMNFRKELSSWIHHNLSNRKDGMHGFAFNLPLFPSFIFPYLLKYFDLGFITAKIAAKNILSSQVVCLITANKDSQTYWIEVGRAIQHIMLELESLGLSCTINIASVENKSKSIQKLLNTTNIPQFLFAIGYMKSKPKYTERVDVNSKIIS